MTSLVLIWFRTVEASSVALALAWPWKCLVFALAWPWAVLKVLGLGLEFSGLGLGLMTCGLINIPDRRYINKCIYIYLNLIRGHVTPNTSLSAEIYHSFPPLYQSAHDI